MLFKKNELIDMYIDDTSIFKYKNNYYLYININKINIFIFIYLKT